MASNLYSDQMTYLVCLTYAKYGVDNNGLNGSYSQ